jgi:hypothetical protein
MLPTYPSPALPDRLRLQLWRVFLTCGHEMGRVHAGPEMASLVTMGQGQLQARRERRERLGHGSTWE